MRFSILVLPAILAVSMNLHAADVAAIPLAVDANATEFVTRTNEATGNIELQKADGSWQLVAIKDPNYNSELPVEKVQYYGGYGGGYGGYGYGYDCPPEYYPPPPPPCCNTYAPPVYYPGPTPYVYGGGGYYGPNRGWAGGGYRYNQWRRW